MKKITCLLIFITLLSFASLVSADWIKEQEELKTIKQPDELNHLLNQAANGPTL
jgi:hypothetical protein|tara:strand:+ start:775 stop:936 length:162 start_codon:yes stop_codon:yes gene_type:complete